ncbi:DNA alkylation repair protein [Treponema zioleckii]|uniref:DNA alkylation repair protein n=1 Tax=Treponema zioleckii TaxID=331680 RepID=UPI00168BA13A|nr:DNA alkylation repair protein [Treponema zioleckii]
MSQITEHLFLLKDEKYRDFMALLIPNVEADRVIGIRTPALRSYAKELCAPENEFLRTEFLKDLPHKYFEENQLHAFIISLQKNFDFCISLLENFLPFVESWATTDQMSPKIFKKHHSELLPYIEKWICSKKTYTVRYAILLLMQHFLDEDFDKKYLEKVAAVRSDEYYVNMMIAWYFATALAKQYDSALPYIQKKSLEGWTHNKAIQKAIESFRVSKEHKDYLRTLKIKLPKKCSN